MTWSYVTKICLILQGLNIKSYPEDTGYDDIHTWVFFAEPWRAADVILFAEKVLAKAGGTPPGIRCEILPENAELAPGCYGTTIQLPLGIHKLTGRRSTFLDRNGQPLRNSLALLRNITPVSSVIFTSVLERLTRPVTSLETEERVRNRKKVDQVMQKCNVMRYLKEKAREQKELGHIDRLTLLGVLGHLGPAGHQKFHQIIGLTYRYDPKITQKWLNRLKYYPLSCPKIRQWHSDITPVIGCYCTFRCSADSYLLVPTLCVGIQPRRSSVLSKWLK